MSPFNLNSAVDVDEENKVIPTTSFNPATAQDIPESAPKGGEPGILTKILRPIFGTSVLEKLQTQSFLLDQIQKGKLPDAKGKQPTESTPDYENRMNAWGGEVKTLLAEREKNIEKEGLGRVLEYPMALGMGEYTLAKPIESAAFAGLYTVKDHIFNARNFIENKYPNASGNVKEIAEAADMLVTGGLLGKGIAETKNMFNTRLTNLGVPTSVLIEPHQIDAIKSSEDLTDKEKTSILDKMGIEDKHVQASLNNDLPVKIPADKILDVANEPYWDKAKAILTIPEKPTENVTEPIVKNHNIYNVDAETGKLNKADIETGVKTRVPWTSDEGKQIADQLGIKDFENEYEAKQLAKAQTIPEAKIGKEVKEGGQPAQELEQRTKSDAEVKEEASLPSEAGQSTIPGIDKLAGMTKEVVNVVSPRSSVPKPALDKIMEMKGQRDKIEFDLEQQLHDTENSIDKWPKEKQIQFVDKIKKGEKQESPELDKLAEMMRTVEDNYYSEVKKFKPSATYKENHFRVLWKTIPGAKEAKGFKGAFRRPLQGSKGFLKQSTLDTMSEGIEMGGEPYSYNPMTMWRNSIVDMQKFITAQKMFKSMKDMGYAKFVKFGEQAPEGYVRLNDSIAKTYFPAEEGLVNAGDWVVEENTGRILNNFLSKDLIRSSEIGSSLLKLKNVTTSIELSLSPFHAAYVSLSTGASSIGTGIQRMVNKGILEQNPHAFLDGLKDIIFSGKAPVDYAKTGGRAIKFVAQEDFVNTPEGKDFIKEYPEAKQLMEDLFTGGGKLAMHQDYKINSLKAFQEGIKNKEPWAVAWNSIPAANELIMKPLFEHYIPRLKIGTFLKEYSLELAQRSQELEAGTLTRPELSRRVWDSVENRLGEMNFDNLFWDRTFKSALQLAFRSVTWKIGALKNIGAALPEQISEIKNATEQGRVPLLTGNMAWLAGVATLATAFSYVTMGMTGQGQPKNLKDLIAPKYDKEGNRISLNTHIKDWVHLWHNPLQFITNSLSGEIGRAIDVWNNKDFYGVEIYHPDDPGWRQAFDVVKSLFPTPFSISSQKKLKGSDAPFALKASTALGFTQPSPGYISNTPAEEEAYKIMHGKLPVGARTKQQFEKSQLKSELRNQVEKTGDNGNLDRAVQEGKLSTKDRREIVKESKQNTLERITHNFSVDEVAKVIEKASKEEKDILIPIFNRKYTHKLRTADREERERLKVLKEAILKIQ